MLIIAARRLLVFLLSSVALLASSSAAAFEAGVTDLDGDGRSDILWRNTQTGQVYRLAMNGLAVAGGGMVHHEPDTNWKIVGDGDFDADGRSDLVWRHDDDGRIYIMLMAPGGGAGAGAVVHVEPNMRWHIVATTDLDGDGRADLVWWNEATGQVYAMLMNGAAIASQGFVYAEPNTNWRIVGGDTGLLMWRNQATGQVYRQVLSRVGGAWTTSGAFIYIEPNLAWRIVGLVDLNGDGSPDILWRNSATGQVYGLLLSGAAVVSGGMVHVEANADWQIVALGDYDGDGRSDILWRNFATGQVYAMRMSGFAVTQQGHVYVEPEQYWRVLGAHDYSWDDRIDAEHVTQLINTPPTSLQMPASCSSGTRVNCPGGIPTPTSATFALKGLTSDSFGNVMYEVEANAPNVVVETLGMLCYMTFNSLGGTYASWKIIGRVATGSTYAGGFPSNRLSRAIETINQFETADVTVSGSFSCSLLDLGLGFYVNTVRDMLANAFSTYLCGAPGPQDFMKCTAQ